MKCLKCKAQISSESEGKLFTRSSSEPVLLRAKKTVIPRHFWLCNRCFSAMPRKATPPPESRAA